MENFAKKLAINQHISNTSHKSFFPMKFLNEDFEVIEKAYELLSESVTSGVPIPPSGEWLLDNFYIIEEQVGAISNSLSVKKYKKLPSVNGVARIYILARELVKFTDGVITGENVELFINSYESKKALMQEELYEFPTMLQIALVEHISRVASKIIAEQLQKFKVESLVERIIKNQDTSKQKFHQYKSVNLDNEAASYVEYLIYLLKKMGSAGKPYLDILEEEIVKVGSTSSEVIKAEHYAIAVQRVSISNGILSIKNVSRLNWAGIFQNVSCIEKILSQDMLYHKLDFHTKEMYRNAISKMAKEMLVSEIYVANKVNEFVSQEGLDIGEALVGDKREEFLDFIGYKMKLRDRVKRVLKKHKLFEYLAFIYLPTILISLLISPNFSIVLFIPISEAVLTIVNRIISKYVKPKTLPRLEKVPDDVNTFVIVPTLLNSAARVEHMVNSLEIYYLANRGMNDGEIHSGKLYFCLLGDASEEDTQTVPHDEEVISAGRKAIERLNEKYNTNLFHFIYRKRVYNPSQEKWLGYERKRGMICEFNHFLLRGEEGTFIVNTIKEKFPKMPKIKYVITLDADTELVLDSAQKLIGTMEHPVNKPIIKNGIVTHGYGLIQPKVGLSIESSTASVFSRLYAGSGGIDIYSTAESNVYQDVFEEAIFTGKGIYHVEVFDKVLTGEIPENTVLSHDLLEGSYLRVGLASDIEVIDGFPSRVNSYMLRLHRWTRGDWQIVRWLKNKKINGLSKYKILDNLRRSLVDIFLLALFFCGFFWTPLILVFFPFLFEIEENVFHIFGRLGGLLFTRSFLQKIFKFSTRSGIDGVERGVRGFKLFKYVKKRRGGKSFFPRMNGIKGAFFRGLIDLILLPYKAVVYLSAICVTVYRMVFSKKHLLEWVTAADAEKMLGKNLATYIGEMVISPLIGLALILTTLVYNPLSLVQVSLLFVLWWCAPIVAYFISKPHDSEKVVVSDSDKEELLDIAQRTWKFFDVYMNAENHFLPPDNYEENRRLQTTPHTSSTNIGLGLLAIISARDLGFLSEEEMVSRLTKSISVIDSLEKWNGHLYNWYNIKNLEPLRPAFISTVDSGNFVGYLYVVKNVLMEVLEKQLEKNEVLKLVKIVDELIANTDFSKLYDFEKNLFSIGYDERENRLVDSYYDLLASEARQASFVAIAKRDVPYKHWFNLGRALTTLNGYKGLVSWAGTMFEYFMPYLIMPSYPYSLLEEAYQFSIYSQKEYAKKLSIPWGISESAFNLQDLNYNYQYKAFGIPWLGLKRGLKEEVVVAPYASILTIEKNYQDVLKNVHALKKLKAYDKYGFYESIDFTPKRLEKNQKYEVVKTYMAHHQALILLSINNLMNQNILQREFVKNPEIRATQILLQERVPQNVVYTKEKKEKVNILKYKDYEELNELVIHKAEGNVNICANDKYTMLINDFGEGYSKLNDIYLTKYHNSYKQSSVVYVKNLDENIYWSNTLYPVEKEPDCYECVFSSSESKFYRKDGYIETLTRISVSPEENVEIKQLEVRNTGDTAVNLQLMSYEEVILTEKNSDIVHPVYNNLFLCTNNLDGKVLLEKKFHNGQKMYLTNFANAEDENIKFEVELDKTKIIGRNRCIKNPVIIEESKMFSNDISSVANTAIAINTTVQIPAGEKVVIHYYMGVAEHFEEIQNIIDKFSKKDAEKRLFEMAKSRSVVENRFFGLKAKNVLLYNQILSLIYRGSQTREKYADRIAQNTGSQRDLWKYGISGDFPIILVKIKNVNDVFVIKELMNAIEYFLLKNIKVDLVIIDEERGSEKYTSAKIMEHVYAKNIAYLMNANGGIHLLSRNNIQNGDMNLLYSCSDIIWEAKNGFLKELLKE
ncbi:MAG: hypothetical protein IJ215_01865 [Clostridia bacterium]|nr:hypothetical protein [Clostridia bacterium]